MIKKNGSLIGKEFNEFFGNYVVYGTPTLTGTVLSGCSTSSYLQYSFTSGIYTSDSIITFCGSFIVPSERNLLWTVNRDYWRVRIEITSTNIIFTNSNWSGINQSFSSSASVGDKLYYRGTFTNGAQTLKVYKNGVEIISGTSSHTNPDSWSHEGEYIRIRNICFGGTPASLISGVSCNSVQDLADFLMLVDDKPIYAPIIKSSSISEYQVVSPLFYEV